VAKKLKRVDITYRKNKGGWVAKSGGKKVDSADTKADLVTKVARKARKSKGTSLRIHSRSGQIQEERTYPRSADPRSSKG
jgi:predicted secreted protein